MNLSPFVTGTVVQLTKLELGVHKGPISNLGFKEVFKMTKVIDVDTLLVGSCV